MQNTLPESIKAKISKEAQSAADKKVYENGDDPYMGYREGYEAGLTAAISNPGEWNLAGVWVKAAERLPEPGRDVIVRWWYQDEFSRIEITNEHQLRYWMETGREEYEWLDNSASPHHR